MAKTTQRNPECTYHLLKRFAPTGEEPADQGTADMIARIDEEPEARACDLTNCELTGADMTRVMRPNGVSTEDLSLIATTALDGCGFGEDAATTVGTREKFERIVNPEA